ncbi:MAG: cysteine--tRNA ligase [Anaerolineae bacterium]|nr:cysteine--tRNA ligase [Anaerolineae bacterium]
MSLQLYNYLTRKKEIFEPLHEGFVGMYVCGPTVYGHAHIGHAKAYISFDVLHRYLEYVGYRVRYVQNITDVGHLTDDADEGEDKIGKQAQKERVEPMEVVEFYTRSFFESMDALNVLRPDISPRASGHVPEQIELAEELIAKGVAYESNGSVFFSVKDWPPYGKLSGRKVEEQEEGARVEINPDKRDPRDFAVWRAATSDHIMQWSSPWGQGYPGWHAECTVMSRKYLGLPFDIHGGGLENIFPHNESEVAQCEAAYGTEFAHFWVLNNMVTVDGTKMGKSLGNFTTVKDALTRHAPTTIRFFVLSSHYRSNTDFSDEALEAAGKGYERLIGAVGQVRQRLASQQLAGADVEQAADDAFGQVIAQHKARFLAAMDDDLNTPQAMATLFDLNKVVNTLLNSGDAVSGGTLKAVDEAYRELGGGILGLIPDQLPQEAAAGLDDALMRLIIDLRAQARSSKDWATADTIRRRLTEIGVSLEDRPESTVWRLDK